MENNFEIADASELDKQQTYAEKLASTGAEFGLAVGSAFAESMRNTYYRHSGTAISELIDNALEAGASSIHVACKFPRNSTSKPEGLAVIDNGHGMISDMLQFAVIWGGTHREGSRRGFGRFGFGLPSASLNQARRFSVYSMVKGGEWHGVTIDLDDLASGKYNSEKTKQPVAPQPKAATPPKWVNEYIANNFGKDKFTSGSVVLLEKVDRLSWSSSAGLKRNLIQYFGVTYRNYLGNTAITVLGDRVESTDPLFITPGFRGFDEDEDRAKALPPAEILVAPKDQKDKVPIRVRFARFPLTFFAKDKTKKAFKTNQNNRWKIMYENQGIVINRMGRQIHVINQTNWDNLERLDTNNDRYWCAEIDFPAELDEEFQVSNSKQGAYFSERIWTLLKAAGVEAAIRQIREDIEREQKDKKVKPAEGEDKPLPSENTMAEAEKTFRKKPGANSKEREELARKNLEQQIKRQSRNENRSEDEVRRELEERAQKRPWQVQFEENPGAPFYRIEQQGGAKILFINKRHRFYTDIYACDETTDHQRRQLEVLMFSVGAAELDAQGNLEKRMFYNVERACWSEFLATTLEYLNEYEKVDGRKKTGTENAAA